MDCNMLIFHDADKTDGFLSNWYLSDFVLDGMIFSSVEKYLMYRKAEQFGDKKQMQLILSSDDPAYIKDCGRAVTPFNAVLWDGMSQAVLYRALMAKFTQNVPLRQKLLATGDRILVEGTSEDRRYANGLSRQDPDRFDMSRWQGKNLLGFTLMEVRRVLSGK